MFGLIKGFSTKTIATVVCTIIVILALTTVYLYRSNNNKLVENGSLKTDNVVLQQNEVFLESSAQITDKVVKEFVEETTKANTAAEKLRKESIHEYVTNKGTFKDGDVRQDIDTDNGNERVALLANRLLENYCRIRPEDPDCDTLNPNTRLSDRQTSK